MTWPPQLQLQSSWRLFGRIGRQLDDLKMTNTEIVGDLSEVKELLQKMSQQLTQMGLQLVQGQENIMSALDDLKTAVNDAAAEMEHAAQTITTHPNPDVSNDPELMALATRLNTATAALKAVEPADTVTPPPSPEPAPADGSTPPTA